MRVQSHWALFGLTKAERDAIDPKYFAKPPDEFPCDTQKHFDAAVKLLGREPEEEQPAIKKRMLAIAKEEDWTLPETWKDAGAKMSAEFIATGTTFEDGNICYVGKVFEAGSYPDKNFEINEAELAEKAGQFDGVELDLEHSDFTDLLGHKLGRLEAIYVAGKTALGQLSVPTWLHELAGGTLKTSLSFAADKSIVGCALTLNPRISDAQVQAAFTKFAGARYSSEDAQRVQDIHDTAAALGAKCGTEMAGARNSKGDAEAHQQMHDLAVQQGAVCPPAQMGRPRQHDPAQGQPPTAKETQVKTELSDKLKAYFAANPAAAKAAGLSEAEITALQTSATTEVDPALQTQLSESDKRFTALQAQIDRQDAVILAQKAAEFARDVIEVQKKAYPSERASLEATFIMAAKADGAGGRANFAANGELVKGANHAVVMESVKNRRPLSTFDQSKSIPDAEAADDTTPDGKKRVSMEKINAGAVNSYNGGGC